MAQTTPSGAKALWSDCQAATPDKPQDGRTAQGTQALLQSCCRWSQGPRHTATLVVECERANKEGPDGLAPSPLPGDQDTREGNKRHKQRLKVRENPAVLNLSENYQHEHMWHFIFR